MLQLDAIYKAAHVLKEVVRRTDLIYAPQINPESTVYLKPENLQLTGSFKVRGAYYKISQLSDEEKARGVIACSLSIPIPNTLDSTATNTLDLS